VHPNLKKACNIWNFTKENLKKKMGLLSCATIVVITVLLELSIGDKVIPKKCCPGNQVLDAELHKCVDIPAVFKTYQEESQVNEPIFQCSNGWEFLKTENQTDDGAIVEPRFNQILQINQYCVHSVVINADDVRNETVIAFCRAPLLQVQKCCPFGQSVKRHSIGECIPNDRVFNASKIVTPAGWPFQVVDNSSLICEYDYNIYVPKMFVDNRFEVNASGHFVVKRAMYKVLRHSKNYCVDTAVDDEGKEEVIASQFF
jgi:hypothetical protein